MIRNQIEISDEIKESGRNFCEKDAFARHGIRQHDVERTDPVAGHNQQSWSLSVDGGNGVHIPDFSLAASGVGEVSRFDGGLGVVAGHFGSDDTPACSLTQGRRHSPRAEVRHEP